MDRNIKIALIVVGVLIVVGIVIAVFVMRKKEASTQTTKSSQQNTGNLMFTTDTNGNAITQWVGYINDSVNGYTLSIHLAQENGSYWLIDNLGSDTNVLYTIINGKKYAISEKYSDIPPTLVEYDSTMPEKYCGLYTQRDNASGQIFNVIKGNTSGLCLYASIDNPPKPFLYNCHGEKNQTAVIFNNQNLTSF